MELEFNKMPKGTKKFATEKLSGMIVIAKSMAFSLLGPPIYPRKTEINSKN
jgi:hypothetical protein